MNTDRSKTLRMVMLAMMVAIGVVISPILRIEGMCPTAHLINIVCSVLLGPWSVSKEWFRFVIPYFHHWKLNWISPEVWQPDLSKHSS